MATPIEQHSVNKVNKVQIQYKYNTMGNFPGSGIRNKQVSDIESGYPDIESGYPDIRI